MRELSIVGSIKLSKLPEPFPILPSGEFQIRRAAKYQKLMRDRFFDLLSRRTYRFATVTDSPSSARPAEARMASQTLATIALEASGRFSSTLGYEIPERAYAFGESDVPHLRKL